MIETTVRCQFTGKKHTFKVPRGHGPAPETPPGWLNVVGFIVAPGPEVKLVVGDKEVVIRPAEEAEYELIIKDGGINPAAKKTTRKRKAKGNE